MVGGQLEKSYGLEPQSYYGGSLVNRLAFLREDYTFLHAAVSHPSTQFLILENLSPYVQKLPRTTDSNNVGFTDQTFTPRPARHALRFVSRGAHDSDVARFIGEPFKIPQAQQITNWTAARDARGTNNPLVVFLGLDLSASKEKSLHYSRTVNKHDKQFHQTYSGQAYFAVDASPKSLTTKALAAKAQTVLANPAHFDGASNKTHPMAIRLSQGEAGLYAQARTYIDWNMRNRFCASCGLRSMSVNGGCKLICPGTDDGKQLPACETQGTLSNLSFPRTDVSILVAVLNHAGDKLLLGRGPKWPPRFYSCLAGFLEPGETLEECVRREVWEEAGLDLGRVVVQASQPWPFPANIMVGCIAQVKEGNKAHKLNLEHDPELEQANWYSFQDISTALQLSVNGYKGERNKDIPFVPTPEALAWTLLESVVNGRIHGIQPKSKL